MRTQVPSNAAITTDENGVCSGRHGGLELYSSFQPVFFAQNKKLELFGYEGLIRPRKNGRSVPHSALFEQRDHAEQLEIDQLCRSLHIRNFHRISNTADKLFLNMNPALIDSRETIDRDLAAMLAEIKAARLNPSNVVCEILETCVQDPASISMLSSALRESGLTVAIDDYGVNGSDWQRFAQVRPQILKLDGAIFRRACKSLLATKALRTLASRLYDIGCTLLVEGIENRLQFDIARNAGIILFQGFYLARPGETPMNWPNSTGLATGNTFTSLSQPMNRAAG